MKYTPNLFFSLRFIYRTSSIPYLKSKEDSVQGGTCSTSLKWILMKDDHLCKVRTFTNDVYVVKCL